MQENNESNLDGRAAAGVSLLDEIVRDGVRQMRAAAMQAEVAAFVDAHSGEVHESGRRLVVRNGYHQALEVVTSAGAVGVRQPRVNDKRVDEGTGERKRFASAILPAWARKSPQLAEVLPLLYLHGLSTSDFTPALGGVRVEKDRFTGVAAEDCGRVDHRVVQSELIPRRDSWRRLAVALHRWLGRQSEPPA